MDAGYFDALVRSLDMTPRRGALRWLSAGIVGAMTALTNDDGEAKKKRKRRRKKKKCKGGKTKCGKTCIPVGDCCVDSDSPAGSGQVCEDGVCGCPTGQEDSGGVCGTPPGCGASGNPCFTPSECCSGFCDLLGDGSCRGCSLSGFPCNVTDDCCPDLTCRGFVCTE
jgi:hypothetical protein